MLALAWATLPDLEDYRIGIIMVGLARCIAMVMIWNQIARGDANICAIIVIINSLLQIVLYAPMSLLFVNVISGSTGFRLSYSDTAISVLIVSLTHTVLHFSQNYMYSPSRRRSTLESRW